MARWPECPNSASLPCATTLRLITVADLITYRLRTESVVQCVASAKLPTEYGEFQVHAFENLIDKQTHLALMFGVLETAGTCLCACIHNASRAMYCVPYVATAVRSSTRLCAGSPAKGAACCFT